MDCQTCRAQITANAPGTSGWAAHVHDCPSCADFYMEQMLNRRGFVAEQFPCVHLGYYATMESEEHPYPADCPDRAIVYSPTFNEWGIRIGNVESQGAYTIKHCPWCGLKLPESRLQHWFEELAKLGFDNPFEQEIPEAFRSDQWWRELQDRE